MPYDDDIDDLLGTSSEKITYDLPDIDDIDADHGGIHTRASGGKLAPNSLTEQGAILALKGAPPGWFATVLGIGRTTVQRKLAHLSPMRVLGNGTKLYEVREALPCLVQAKDMKAHISRMNPRDLPERLRKEFWGARKLEQQVRKEAGDLWSSTDVHRAFGDILRLIKDTAILWTDEIDETTGLSSEQIGILDNLVRALLASIGEKVEQYATEGVTQSHEAEYDEDDGDE